MNTMDAIAALDLDAVKIKLMHKESGEGWTLDKANAIEVEYKRFLMLQKIYPMEAIAPLFDVDIFWHYHILDTMKYAIDCQAVFGHFLHHFPYLGLRGESDEEAHEFHGNRTRELYQLAFGGDYPAGAWEEERGDLAVDSLPRQPAVQTAWSVAPPREPAVQTAWSVAPPREPVMQTAWSVAPPRKPAMQTAWSVAPPREPAMQTAWSVAPPRQPAMQTAWSVAPPREPAMQFDLRRPSLEMVS